MKKSFYSNGKLLLTGEYLVLDGAKAWAIPTKFGQYLHVGKTESDTLSWKSIDENKNIWFEAEYDLDSLEERSSSHAGYSEPLQRILLEARVLNPRFLKQERGCFVETELTFPRNWGLGTSSTLINNIAQWAKVDPYQLLAKTFGGSGYDIACAQYDLPICYHLEDGHPKVDPFNYDKALTQSLYFVYLNKKQQSSKAIKNYRALDFDREQLCGTMSDLTDAMIACHDINGFERLMIQHENLISQQLKLPTVKSILFSDYPRAIKSLGAWGGDFVLVAGDLSTMGYFKEKGYGTIIPFKEMIL